MVSMRVKPGESAQLFDERMKTVLSEMRVELIARYQRICAHHRAGQALEGADRAAGMSNEDVIAQLSERTTNELLDIDEALRRLEKGVYTQCTKCGSQIEEKRLEIIPFTRTCSHCA